MDSGLDADIIKKLLLIAFHYPPVKVSSGVQRTLAFSRYLSESDWQPIVLSADPRAYPVTSDDQIVDIPEGVLIKQAFALDSARHVSFKGRYLNVLALPDRWVSWLVGGVFSGKKLIRQHKPTVLWSTYPIATAHLIGWVLHCLTGVPWIADFRDAMVDDVYPPPGIKRRIYAWIEKKTIEACSAAVFTTPGAVDLYKKRYSHISEDKWHLISNGYNEEIFAEVEQSIGSQPAMSDGPLYLVHSGVLYPSERDPNAFFHAVSELKGEGVLSAERVRIVLRATGHDELYTPLLEVRKIDDIVTLAPAVPYREALSEMLQADGLLIFQAANCNHQVPAKLYEYFRARRPILALTDKQGDTASTLTDAGISAIVSLDDKEAIKAALIGFIHGIESKCGEVADADVISQYSRRFASKKLSQLLDRVVISHQNSEKSPGEKPL